MIFEEDKKDKFKDDKLSEFLKWIETHKIFTIVLLILIVFGFGKIAKHFEERIR